MPTPLPRNPVGCHAPKEEPTLDAATQWLSSSERRWLNSRERRRLGYIDATTAPIRRRGAVSFAARQAKELGADAIVVMQQGQEYAGSISNAAPSPQEISTTTASPRPLPKRDSPPRCFSGKLKYSRSSGNKRSLLRPLRNSKDSNPGLKIAVFARRCSGLLGQLTARLCLTPSFLLLAMKGPKSPHQCH